MSKLRLSLAVSYNERSRAILDGTVVPEGIEVLVNRIDDVTELFWRQLRFAEFDVSEMSLSSLLIQMTRGNCPWVALPVFTTRYFFQTWAWVHQDSGIHSPQDLRGKRVGVPEYQQTAAVWTRGILQHDFSVKPQDLEWHMERSEALSHGAATSFVPPPDIRFNRIPPDKSIASMLAARELDATLLYIPYRTLLDRSGQTDRPPIRPLFPDEFAEGARYFSKSGIFPMNHVLVMRRSISEQHPWVPLNLQRAFLAAKDLARKSLLDQADSYFKTGLMPDADRKALLTDLYPYGMAANRKAVETVAQFAYEQGLTPRLVKLDEIFAPSCMDL